MARFFRERCPILSVGAFLLCKVAFCTRPCTLPSAYPSLLSIRFTPPLSSNLPQNSHGRAQIRLYISSSSGSYRLSTLLLWRQMSQWSLYETSAAPSNWRIFGRHLPHTFVHTSRCVSFFLKASYALNGSSHSKYFVGCDCCGLFRLASSAIQAAAHVFLFLAIEPSRGQFISSTAPQMGHKKFHFSGVPAALLHPSSSTFDRRILGRISCRNVGNLAHGAACALSACLNGGLIFVGALRCPVCKLERTLCGCAALCTESRPLCNNVESGK